MAEKIKYTLKHVGINCADEKEAKQLVSLLCSLFDLEPGNENDTHIFVSNMFEVMKDSTRGKHGHIALQTQMWSWPWRIWRRRAFPSRKRPFAGMLTEKVIFVYLDGGHRRLFLPSHQMIV